MDKSFIVVFGGTGNYGRHIVKALLRHGKQVKVLSRNPGKALEILSEKATMVEGDVLDGHSINSILEGARAIIICLSASSSRKQFRKVYEIEQEAVFTILDQCLENNIERVVYTSGYDMRPEVLKGLGIERFGEIKLSVENRIREMDLNWTILGLPPSFELFFALLRGSKLAVPGGGMVPVPTVSPLDVGEIAAQVVLRDDLSHKRIRVTGPEAISFPEAASRMTTITGKSTRHVKIPLRIVRMVTGFLSVFDPFPGFVYQSLLLLNNFPEDISSEVSNDFRYLQETFSYDPVWFDDEIRSRLL